MWLSFKAIFVFFSTKYVFLQKVGQIFLGSYGKKKLKNLVIWFKIPKITFFLLFFLCEFFPS